MTLVVVLVIGMITPHQVAAQVLLNGGFENNPQAGYPVVYAPSYVDSPTNTWQVTQGSVNVGTGPAGTACHGPSGGHCVDLNGNEQGRIEQVIHGFSKGQQCTVTFWMGRHASLSSGTATLNTFTGTGATPTVPSSFTSSATMAGNPGGWKQMSFNFTPVGGLTPETLVFQSGMMGAAGPQIDDVEMTCTTPTDPVVIGTCCPPWNKDLLKSMMYYQGSGSISANYTLHFQPTPLFMSQMQAYTNYLYMISPTCKTITINWSLYSDGITPLPSTLTLMPGTNATTTWTEGSSSPITSGSIFAPSLMHADGTWYGVHTVIQGGPGKNCVPDKCAINDIYARVQAMSAIGPGPTGGTKSKSESVIEFSDGKKVINAVPIK
jgi:hypothetical protein